MKRASIGIIAAVLLLAGMATSAQAIDYTSNGNGTDWGTADNWTPSGVPVAGDNVTIASGCPISTNGSARACAGLTVEAGVTFTAADNVTATGSLTVNGSIAGAGTIILSGSGTTIGGTGSIANPVSITTGAKSISAGADLTFSGTIAITGSITVTNNGTVTAAGDITGSVAGSVWTNAAGSTLNIAGALLATGTVNASANPNTVNYNGAAQSVKAPSGAYYHHLTLSGSGTKTLTTSTWGANGNLTLSGTATTTTVTGIVVYGKLDVGPGTNLNVAAYTLRVDGSIINSGTITRTAGTTLFTANGGFTNNGTYAATAASSPLTVANATAFANNGTFDNGGGNLTFSGTFTNSGTLNTIGAGTVTATGLTTNSGATSTIERKAGSTGLWTLSGGFQNEGNYIASAAASPLTVGVTTGTGAFTNSGTFNNAGNGALVFYGDFTNDQTGADFGSVAVNFGNGTATTSITIGGSAAPTTFWKMTLNRNALATTATLTGDIVATADATDALIITTGTLITDGRSLTVNGGATAALRGGASVNSRLRITGGSVVTVNNLNQGSSNYLGQVYVENGTLDVQGTHTVTYRGTQNAGYFELQAGGTVNYNSTGTGLDLRGSSNTAEVGLNGWYPQGGTVNFYGGVSGTAGDAMNTYRYFARASSTTTVRFLGSTDATVTLNTNSQGTVFWEFGNLVIAKTGGAKVTFTNLGTLGGNFVDMTSLQVNSGATAELFNSFAAGRGYRVSGNVVNNGTLSLNGGSNNVLYVRGNWSGSGRCFTADGVPVTFDGTSANTFSGLIDRLAVSKTGGGSLSAFGYAQVERSLVVNSGTFSVPGGNRLTLGWYELAGALQVRSGGTFSAVGSDRDARAYVTAADYIYPYSFVVNNGGTIAARMAKFDFMNTSGIVVDNGATIDATNNFSDCIFDHGNFAGPMLRIENNQTLTMANVDFVGTAGYNLLKTGIDIGRIMVAGGSGNRWGASYERDPNELIDWQWSHDVGCRFVYAPYGIIDSGTVVTAPACSVHNFGLFAESYRVRLRIDNAYVESCDVVDHAPGTGLRVEFPIAWTALPRGSRTVRCSTELAGDGDSYNDKLQQTVLVRVRDAGVVSITTPSGRYEPGTVIRPAATWRNHGNTAAAFEAWAILEDPTDARVYAEKVDLNLAAGASATPGTFPEWTLGTLGAWTVRCSTGYAGDMVPGNDVVDQAFNVGSPDVGVEEIVVPVGTLIQDTTVYPTVRLHNYGNIPASFNLRFTISTVEDAIVYDETEPVSIPVGEDLEHVFATEYVATTPGTFTGFARHDLAGDVDPVNDTLRGGFLVRPPVPHDVGVVRVSQPPAYVAPNTVVTPTATWRNNSVEPVTFRAWFALIDPSLARVYQQESLVVELGAGLELSVEFAPFDIGASEGNWRARCSTWAAGDPDPGNDVWVKSFLVSSMPPWPFGWQEAEPMPPAPSGKAVKDGGWLALHQGGIDGAPVIYVAKGNKTTDFFRYSPANDSWLPRHAIPDVEGTKTKPPSKGCVGVSDGEKYVYMTKGNNTLGFWRYDVGADAWDSLPGVPLGPGNKKVKGGTDMVYVPVGGDTGWVYLLKGYKTEFYRFNTATLTWDLPLPDAPAGGGKAKYDKGSFLAYDGGNSIYAHQAKYNDGANHHMFRYDLGSGRWADTLKGMPLAGWHSGKPGKNKKSKDGAAGDWFGGNVYAVKGGNTQQFYRYFPDGDSWQELDTVPGDGSTMKKKYVKAGGDFASIGGGVFFLLKGNKTLELWRHKLEAASGAPNTGRIERSGAMAGNVEVRTSKFELFPNPIANGFATVRFSLPEAGPVTLTVFDVAGRSVLRQSTIGNRTSTMTVDLRSLSNGVYLVRLDTQDGTAAQKFLVQHRGGAR